MIAQETPTQDSEARSLPRRHLYLAATIESERGSAAIRIRDLSASGARIEGTIFPPIGAPAHIVRGALSASGSIVWRDARGCGFRFDQPLPLDDWMPPRLASQHPVIEQPVEPATVGEIVLPFRPPTPPAGSLHDALPQRLAEELAYVGRLLEGLGGDLSAEPLVVARHGARLQDLDLATQILAHVAALLVAEHPAQAIDAIAMSSLRNRLLRVRL